MRYRSNIDQYRNIIDIGSILYRDSRGSASSSLEAPLEHRYHHVISSSAPPAESQIADPTAAGNPPQAGHPRCRPEGNHGYNNKTPTVSIRIQISLRFGSRDSSGHLGRATVLYSIVTINRFSLLTARSTARGLLYSA